MGRRRDRPPEAWQLLFCGLPILVMFFSCFSPSRNSSNCLASESWPSAEAARYGDRKTRNDS
jgi:hypothetical protein